MDNDSKVKLVVSRAVFTTLIFAISFIVPILQDYNVKNFPEYKIVKYKTYKIQWGDTLSEIAEKYKPEHMKLSNYMVEIQYANSINREIRLGEKILIPVVELR